MRFINVSTDNYRGRGMRKYPIIPLFFATLVTLALVIGCGDDPVSEPIPTAGTSAQAPEPTAVPVSEWQPGTRQLVDLYREFHAFKHSPKFKLHGFAVCCEYNKWLQKINGFDVDRSFEAFDDIGVDRSGLFVLALDYMDDGGPQSPYAKEIEAKLEAARKAVEAVEGTSTTINNPRATTTLPAVAECPTEAETAYLQAVLAQIEPMGEAMGVISTLFLQSSENLALLRNDTWVTNMAVQLYILRAASDMLRELEPPTKRLNAAHAHTASIEFVTTLVIADIIEGVDNLDVEALTQVSEHMNKLTIEGRALAAAIAALCN